MMSRICEGCGTALNDGTKFCTVCGRLVPTVQTQQVGIPNPYYAQPQPQTYYQTPPQQANYAYQNTAPMTVGQYILTMIISAIPLVGFIMLLVWSFGSNQNINKKNFARAVLIIGIIGGVLSLIFGGIITAALTSIISEYGGSGYYGY